MDIIDTSKSLLENLYYLSGIFILISILVAVWQLILTKRTLRINSKRNAADLAAKQVELYFSIVMPLQNRVYDLEKEKKSNLQK